MGTNYYHVPKGQVGECPHCQRVGYWEAESHIGKSSGGWNFSLHVIPESGIHNLDDWRRVWESTKGTHSIVNEYQDVLTIDEMVAIITKREGVFGDRLRSHVGIKYSRCIGQGEGPYDYIAGEFR